MELGKAISYLRKSKNLTQADLAEKCDCSTTTICNIETGKNSPTQDTFTKISEALEYPKTYFYLYALSEDEVPPEKREMFRFMKNFLVGC